MSETQHTYTPVYPDVAIDSHDLTPCVLCGGVMVTCGDLDLCSSCGSRRVRSQTKQAAAYLPTYAQPSANSSIGPDGEVHYSFNYKAQHIELEVFPDGHLEWFYRNRETEEMWGHDVPPERAAAASRDASLTAFVDDLLDLLQDVGGMSAEWCADRLAQYETLLREG